MAADTAVGLSEVPTGTVRYYSDAACTTSITGATILAGQTNADFYAKPMTGGSALQTATAPFGSAQRALNIVAAVRRGSCFYMAPGVLSDGGPDYDRNVTCPINPPLQNIGRTALFFQATTATADPGTAHVRCRLTATSEITCNRNDASSSGTIHWQTLELPTGLQVGRVTGNCTGSAFTATLPAAVNPASSFLLKSFENASGSVDDDDLLSVRLVSPTMVGLDIGGATVSCAAGSFEVQAVELSGTTVTRGVEDGGIPVAVNTRTVTGLAPTSLNTALLSQHAVPNSSDAVCNMMVRSEMPSPSSLNFSRAGGADAGCLTTPILRMGWERIDFGTRATVQPKTVTLPPGASNLAVSISTVDPTRTIVFASSQAASGQSGGETNYGVSSNYLGEALARFELVTGSTVNVVRQRTGGAATFTFYVVELDP